MPKVKNTADAIPDMMPSVSFEGKHAKKFMKVPIGKKMTLTLKVKKSRHSMYTNPNGDHHSVGFDILGVNDDNDGDE